MTGTNIRQHRNQPDLLQYISQLVRRIEALENAPRLGSTSLDGGELSIKGGDIVVRNEAGEPVTRIEHGDAPRIRFYPVGSNEMQGQIVGWEDGSSGVALQMSVAQPGNIQDGGKLLLMNRSVYLSYQPDGAPEVFLCMSPNTNWPEHFRLQGRWAVGNQWDAQDALVFGVENVGAGFGAASFNFTYPFDTTPFLQYSILSAVGPVSHNLTALSASGFTVGWSGTTAKTIYWQAWRR